jgi:light-regulated signal transduction histidine kinase (bacteriophytochrome)
VRNWIRVVADVDYEPVLIMALLDGPPVDQLDLSLSVLRSVSPLHLQYLRNMGVSATMTISLIVDNQLWGLIACHHSAPKYVNHLQRLAYEALGQLVSVRLRSAEVAKQHEHIQDLRQMAAHVVTCHGGGRRTSGGSQGRGGSAPGYGRRGRRGTQDRRRMGLRRDGPERAGPGPARAAPR